MKVRLQAGSLIAESLAAGIGTIYLARHNSFLSDQAHVLQRRLRPYRRLQLRVRNWLNKLFEEHPSVFDTLGDGRAERAVSAICNHLMVHGERLHNLLAGLSQLEVKALTA